MSRILDRVCDRVFLLGLLGAVCFTLWLPLFPTGDGPVHLYYADVLRSLLHHQPAYAQDYAIRHLFAPYLVHYLALITLEQWVSPAKAEELFICLIFVVTAFGFRALARTLGAHAGLACVWMLPLLFSWSLSGGFLNCCFATGVVLWAFAVWVRLGEQASRPRLAWLFAFAMLLLLLLLSHPVPLMVLLLFTASDLGLRAARTRTVRGAGPQLLAFAFTCCAFIAPVLTAEKGQAAAVLPGMGLHKQVLIEFITGMRLTMFAGVDASTLRGWLNLVARLAAVGLVPAMAMLFVGSRRLRSHGEGNGVAFARSSALVRLPASPAGRLLLISLVYLATTLFFPRSLNHSYFFPERMWDIVWLLVLACGAAIDASRRTQAWVAACAAACLLLTCAAGLPGVAQIARAQARIAAAPLPRGGRGLLLDAAAAGEERGLATSYPVYFWSGARAFETSGAVLLNSPWLGLTILPVKDAPGPAAPHALLDRGLPSLYSENPVTLSGVLTSPASAKDDSLRQAVLARADFLLYVNPPPLRGSQATRDTGAQMRALLGRDGAAWHCEARDLYAVCTRAD